MTDAQKLAITKVLLSGDGADLPSDETLSAYLLIAGDFVIRKAYPHEANVTVVPEQYGVIQCRIAAYLVQNGGNEGVKSQSENGYSVTFADGDIPASLYRLITPFCGVPGFVRTAPEPEGGDTP